MVTFAKMQGSFPHRRPVYTLRELLAYFLKLGYSGFGGPVALVGYMHRDLVVTRRWIAEEEYKEGLALAQLMPGPLAAQLCIYLGFVQYGVLGATLAGLAFILPSFVMVVALGIAYGLFGGLAWMRAAFYGVGAAVIGIIAISAYKLTVRSVSKFTIKEIRTAWLRWTFYLAAMLVTILTHSEQVLLFILAGLIYMVVKARPRWMDRRKPKSPTTRNSVFLLAGIGKMGLFFLKAGAFVFGSGLAIVPFLHDGVVVEYHWLTEQQFLDAVAVAMITPGPVVITVGFIGYLVGGFPGAVIASLATFLPCYLLTILPAPFFRRLAKNTSIKAFVDGITAAVMGALAGAVVVIGLRSIRDLPTACIAAFTLLSLIWFKKLPEPLIILIAAIFGMICSPI